MKINTNILYKISLIYLLLPLIIFCTCWLNPFFATISVFTLFFITYSILCDKQDFSSNKTFKIGYISIVLALTISFFWCLSAGIGGLFYQHPPDWSFRNAIIRDLTTFSWPVYYENNITLTYYFGFMLVPVFLAKVLGQYFAIDVLSFANSLSLLWSVIGVFLCFINLFVITKSNGLKNIIVMLMLICFTGLDIFISGKAYSWHPPFSYLSNTYQLFFSFHSTIPIWLATILFMQKPNNFKYYGVLGIIFCFFLPQSLYCIGIFYIWYLAKELFLSIKKANLGFFVKEIFDKKNLLSTLIIFPIIYLFFASNHTTTYSYFFVHKFSIFAFKSVFFGVGIYILLILLKYYKKDLYWLNSIILIIFPFLAFKTPYDFMMRATIPAIIILMILVIKFLFEEYHYKTMKKHLILAILIGALSPILMIGNACLNQIIWRQTILNDEIITFKGKITPENKPTDMQFDFRNYASIDCQKYIFWKYLAKNSPYRINYNKS